MYIRCIYGIFSREITYIRSYTVYIYGSGQPYICTVRDRIFGDFPAKHAVYAPYTYGSGQAIPCQKYRLYTIYTWFWPTNPLPNMPFIHHIHMVLANKFPARNTVYTPYTYMVLADPTYYAHCPPPAFLQCHARRTDTLPVLAIGITQI
jgi:hypothetical protein